MSTHQVLYIDTVRYGTITVQTGFPVFGMYLRTCCALLVPTSQPLLQVVWWLVTSSGECDGDRATAARLGQDLVSHRLLTPVCAGYDRPKDSAGSATGAGGGGGSEREQHTDLFGSFDDAAGWLFAFGGDALRNPFAPPPPIQVAVMTNTGVEVGVTGWIEVSRVALHFEPALLVGL